MAAPLEAQQFFSSNFESEEMPSLAIVDTYQTEVMGSAAPESSAVLLLFCFSNFESTDMPSLDIVDTSVFRPRSSMYSRK